MKLANICVLVAAASIQAGAQHPDQCLTQQQGIQILDELKRLRNVIESQTALRAQLDPTPRTVVLDVTGAPSIGSESAPVTMVEFTDYQCPFCQRFHEDVFPQIKKQYIDTGRVRFVVLNLPLDVHPNAMQAALAATCAREQGVFWPMHNQLQANPERLSIGDLVRYGMR